jgi:hypothetical protein
MNIRAPHPLRRLQQFWRRHFAHPFAEGRDGFWAFDPATRAATDGLAPGAAVRAARAPSSSLDPVLHFLGRNLRGEPVRIPLGPQTFSGRTQKYGETFVPLSMAQPLLQSERVVDAARGGTLMLQVEAADTRQVATSRVLALPSDYDGPLFVCDIDNTLRNTSYSKLILGRLQPPIPGAAPLLHAIAAMGVPILYLSAGTSRFHEDNQRFLAQLPAGVLLDRGHMSLADLDPTNHAQARRQGRYKLGTLRELVGALPKAQLFEMGDDRYGDAMVYQQIGAKAYIHDVKPDHKNLPPDFRGVLTKDYDDAFRDRVLSDLSTAIAHSGSYGGETLPWRGLPGERPPFDVVLRHRLDNESAPDDVKDAVAAGLATHPDALSLTATLPDGTLSRLPATARACLADELMRAAAHGSDAAQCQAQLLRALAAGGTAADLDTVLHNMQLSHHLPATPQIVALLRSNAARPGDWAAFDTYRIQGGRSAQMLSTPLLRAIDTAQHHVQLALPQLRDPDLINHVMAAAERGVQVDLLLPAPAARSADNDHDGEDRDGDERELQSALQSTQHVRLLIGAPTQNIAIFDKARACVQTDADHADATWTDDITAATHDFDTAANHTVTLDAYRPGLFTAVLEQAAWREHTEL